MIDIPVGQKKADPVADAQILAVSFHGRVGCPSANKTVVVGPDIQVPDASGNAVPFPPLIGVVKLQRTCHFIGSNNGSLIKML